MDRVINKYLFKENVKCKISKKILSGKYDGCLEKVYDLIGNEFSVNGFFNERVVTLGNGRVISIDIDDENFIFNLEIVSIIGKFDTRFLDLYIDVDIEDGKIGDDGVDIVVETFSSEKIDDLEILKLGLEGVLGFVTKKKKKEKRLTNLFFVFFIYSLIIRL